MAPLPAIPFPARSAVGLTSSEPCPGPGASTGSIPLLDDLKIAAPAEGIERRLVVKRTSMRAARASRLMMHRHQYCEIFWYVIGGGAILTDDGRRSFEAPALIVMRPGRAHTAELRMETAGWLAAFSQEMTHQEGGACDSLGSLPLFGAGSRLEHVREVRSPESVDEITRLFQKMLQEYQSRGKWRDLCLQSCLRLLLIKAARLFPETPAAGGGTAAMITRRFLAEVESGYLRERQVGSYAAMLGLSPQRLMQCVRQELGRTPGAVISERVLVEAKRLLFHTSRTVAEIAYELGFKDPSHFGHFFRKAHGCPPREARLRFVGQSLEAPPSREAD